MKKIRFWKMSGSGNDFVVIDRRNPVLVEDPSRFTQKVCRRNVSVGADGVLFLEESTRADFMMRIFNADGSEAEMCGNGARCIARFAYLQGIAGKTMTFETLAGIMKAEVSRERVKIQMSEIKDLALHRRILVEGKEYLVHSLNTGVPHTVLLFQNLEEAPVLDLGRKIRFHEAFSPAGTNVNFIDVTDSHHISIRTYERGVEDETLACGTGAVASALASSALGVVDSPVFLRTRGEEVLVIYFRREGLKFSEILMEGSTAVAYEGELWDEALT